MLHKHKVYMYAEDVHFGFPVDFNVLSPSYTKVQCVGLQGPLGVIHHRP